MRLYRSLDNGQFYLPEHVDDPGNGMWQAIDVNDVVTLTPTQLCASDSLLQILMEADQAQVVTS